MQLWSLRRLSGPPQHRLTLHSLRLRAQRRNTLFIFVEIVLTKTLSPLPGASSCAEHMLGLLERSKLREVKQKASQAPYCAVLTFSVGVLQFDAAIASIFFKPSGLTLLSLNTHMDKGMNNLVSLASGLVGWRKENTYCVAKMQLRIKSGRA